MEDKKRMGENMPRILFAAPKSGSGKTMITCGIIEVLKRRGLRPASFKCGPDYIDPMFHRRVLGIPSGNLDTFFTDRELTRYLLWEQAKKADVTVLEGVMGYYDGLGGTSERASTYEIAEVTDTPVILVVDAAGASVSLAALIKGMLTYRKEHHIRGVILNRVSPGYYGRLKEVIERECSIEVLGYVPKLPDLQVPSRHLGLVSPQELDAFETWIGKIADALEQGIDIEGLLAIAKEAASYEAKIPALPQLSKKVRLAVARDEAFSFYYAENISLLERMGAELTYFSPLHDEALPEGIDGLILWGGYPERYAKELERGSKMRAAIFEACHRGIPCLAECGGFLYLQKELEGEDGRFYEMAGVFPGTASRRNHLVRFGYMEAQIFRGGVLGGRGEKIRGHEFHYWDCTENGMDLLAQKPMGGKDYPCMIHSHAMAAGFPHFYYYSNPNMLYRFLTACSSYQAGRAAKEHWDRIAKPIDSLGLLEEAVVRLSKIRGSAEPEQLKKRGLLILCGDHGVVEEGVTQTGKEVTRIVSENFAKGCSTVNYMAESATVDVYTIDLGMDAPAYPQQELIPGAVVNRKVAKGTKNLAKEAAMSREECQRAVEIGRTLVREMKEKGYQILATGEMGIGNTTPTSVLAAVFLQQSPEKVTGKGAGLSKEGVQKKCRVVEAAVNRIREKGLTDPMDILAEAGGYEIAGMVGIFLGGVDCRIPIVMDGAISAVAALTAMRIDARAADFVLASHESEESAGKLALEALGVEAILHGRMCLGEGSGAMALFPLLDMAMAVYENMGTFTEYEIKPYTRFEEEE